MGHFGEHPRDRSRPALRLSGSEPLGATPRAAAYGVRATQRDCASAVDTTAEGRRARSRTWAEAYASGQRNDARVVGTAAFVRAVQSVVDHAAAVGRTDVLCRGQRTHRRV